MAHKALKDLEQDLIDAANLVRIGGHYAHYKHPDQPYEVAGLAILESTDKVAVRYAALENPAVEFLRPLSSWLETVEWDGKVVARFMLLP